jgi:hypothetical protein
MAETHQRTLVKLHALSMTNVLTDWHNATQLKSTAAAAAAVAAVV